MRKRWSWLVLVVILAFDLWLRGHAFGPAVRDRTGLDLYPVTSVESEPLDCDEAIYGYIGKRLAGGAVMYRDLTENKPPGGYWIYALAVLVGGPTELTIRALPVPFVLGAVVLVWWVAGRLRGSAAAAVAAFTFALVSTDPFLYGESANMEHMINFFAFAALALFIEGWRRPGRGWLVCSGLALGFACLVKQTAVVNAPMFASALLIRRAVGTGDASARRSVRARLTDVAAFATGAVTVIAIAVVVVVAQGAGSEAHDDIFRYGRALAIEAPAPRNAPHWLVRWVAGNADPEGRLPWPFGTTNYLVWWGTGTWPIWAGGLTGVAWLLLGPGRSATGRLVAAWTLSAGVQVAMPRLFWQHYYLLPTPGLAVAFAIVLLDQWTSITKERRRWPHLIVGLLLLAGLADTIRLQVVEYVRVPPQELVKDRGGAQWVVNRSLGREIGRRAAVFERPTLFVWGWQGPLYFYSGLDGVTPQVFVDDFLKAFASSDHPLVRPRIERTLRDLSEQPPAIVFTGYPPFQELKRFLEAGYLPSRLAPGLWVRRDRYGEFEAYPAR